jgi:hypothetical protein
MAARRVAIGNTEGIGAGTATLGGSLGGGQPDIGAFVEECADTAILGYSPEMEATRFVAGQP